MIKIPIVNRSPHPLPEYQTSGSAGLDIRAWLSSPLELKPLGRVLVPTGIHLEIPSGYEVQIRPRSGLAIKKGLTIVNAPGTIDSDYRGEVKIAMVNLSSEAQIINDGDRIAQMILARHETVSWQLVEELAESIRGEAGFGHTGIE